MPEQVRHDGSAGAARADGSFVDLPKVKSANIRPMHVTIWLPPGYGRGHQRYPVIYMQDGHNLFFLKDSNFNKVWVADKSMLRLIKAGEAPPAIIVGTWAPGADRARTYMPARIYAALPPDVKADADSFMGGPNQSDAYLKFLVTELKPMIDRRYRTLADRAHTTVMGSSMGGLISLYAIAEYPDVFGQAGCVSTHWPLIDPRKVGPARPDVLGIWLAYLTARLGEPHGRRIWFDHGDQTLDQFYGPWQSAIDRHLTEIGWQIGRDMQSKSYPGAAHEENAWAARLDEIFTWLQNPPDE